MKNSSPAARSFENFHYFCSRSMPGLLLAEDARGGTDIEKGVYYALVLTFWNRRKISKASQRQSSGECSKGVLCTDPIMPDCHWCIRTSMAPVRRKRAAYISAWGFGVARFDFQGLSYEPQNVKRATVQGFTLFLCPPFIFTLYQKPWKTNTIYRQ